MILCMSILLNVNIFVILRYFSQYCVVDLIKSIKMWQCLVSFNAFFFFFFFSFGTMGNKQFSKVALAI